MFAETHVDLAVTTNNVSKTRMANFGFIILVMART